MLIQQLARAANNGLWQSRELRNVNAEALLRPAFLDLVKVLHLTVALAHGEVKIPHARQVFRATCQLMVMGCEQRLCAGSRLVVEILYHRAGYRKPVGG